MIRTNKLQWCWDWEGYALRPALVGVRGYVLRLTLSVICDSESCVNPSQEVDSQCGVSCGIWGEVCIVN